MAKIDKTYHNLLKQILDEGFRYEDPNRKGVHRIQIPSAQIVHNFTDGFPAITTKKLYWKGVVGELLWFLRGDTNIKYLVDNNINIWNKDAYNYYLKQGKGLPKDVKFSFKEFITEIKEGEDMLGDLGRVYGAQWRKWTKNVMKSANDGMFGMKMLNEPIDQISELITGLKENPMGTRHIVPAWNPAELEDMALPPCHWSFEILVEPINYIERFQVNNNDINGIYQPKDWGKEEKKDIKYQFTLKWHQRSVDTFLGLPFNIASYASLAHIIGKITNMVPKGIIGDLSNVHIYEAHLDAVKEQLSRDVNKHGNCKLGIMSHIDSLINNLNKGLHPNKTLDEFLYNLRIKDFKLLDYESYDRIPAEMLAYNK